MPIFDLECPACATQIVDRFFHVRPTGDDMPICPQCGHRMATLITTRFSSLTQTFAEDRGRWDHNISPDGKPVWITSWGQRKALMKQYNLEEVGAKRGMPGAW